MSTVTIIDFANKTKLNEYWTTSSWQFSDYEKDFQRYSLKIDLALGMWAQANPPEYPETGYYGRLEELRRFANIFYNKYQIFAMEWLATHGIGYKDLPEFYKKMDNKIEPMFNDFYQKMEKKHAFDLNDAIEVAGIEYGAYTGDEHESIEERMERIFKDSDF